MTLELLRLNSNISKLNLDKFTRVIKGKCMALESSAITNKLNKFK